MTQQINLYQPELHKKRVPFSSARMASVAAAVFILLLAAAAAGHWRLTGLASAVDRLEDRRDAALERVKDYQHRYPPRSADPGLVRDVEAMQTERQARQALLRLLTDDRPAHAVGFSDYLVGLARQDIPTVWLRRIRFSAGGDRLLIEGRTARASDVPRYLQHLSDQAVFNGREFETLKLSRTDAAAQYIDFLLQTTAEEAP